VYRGARRHGDHRGPGKADGSRWIQLATDMLGDTMRHERKQGKIWEDNLMNWVYFHTAMFGEMRGYWPSLSLSWATSAVWTCGTSAAELQVGIFHCGLQCVQLNPTLRSFICYPPFTCSKTEKTTAIHSQASANETRSRKMACKTPWQADPVIVAWIVTPVGSSGRKQDSYCSSICTWHFDKAVLAVATCGNCVLIASAYWRALSKTLQKHVEITTKAHLSFQNPPIA